MQDLSNINTIKEILSAHGFTFSKSLGQNFLINPTVCPRMAEACGADENTGVIEIGAHGHKILLLRLYPENAHSYFPEQELLLSSGITLRILL